MEEPKISTESRLLKKGVLINGGWPARHSHHRGFFIEDIRKGASRAVEAHGGLAARICLQGTGETNDAYICEIPAGKAWNRRNICSKS